MICDRDCAQVRWFVIHGVQISCHAIPCILTTVRGFVDSASAEQTINHETNPRASTAGLRRGGAADSNSARPSHLQRESQLRPYVRYFPGVNGATSGTIHSGKQIPLQHSPDKTLNFDHNWGSVRESIDHGKMDHFDLGPCKPAPYKCYSQYQEADISNYFAYARSYLIADNFFSSLTGPSFPQSSLFDRFTVRDSGRQSQQYG